VRRYGLSVVCEPPEPSGAATYAIELARAMAPLLDEDERLLWIRHARFPAAPRHPRVLDLAIPFPCARSSVRRLAEQALVPPAALLARIDLLHCPNHVLPLAWPRASVLTVHDARLFEGRAAADPGRRLFRDLVYPESLRRAGAVIAVSDDAARQVGAAFGAPRERFRVIRHGTSARFAAGEPARGRALLEGTAAAGRPIVLHVGQQEPHKNLPRLAGAFARALAAGLRVEGERPTLVLAGSRGAGTAALEARIAALALERDVARLGYVAAEDLPDLYAAARLLAYPSTLEGFGLPPLEAMAAGVPVLAADIPVLREVSGDAAHLVDPLDEDAIAAGLAALATEEPLRAALVARGRDRVREMGWRRPAEETLAVYREVAGAKRRASR
jgi:glycosyltransferase involved in cell wall biosynthesis